MPNPPAPLDTLVSSDQHGNRNTTSSVRGRGRDIPVANESRPKRHLPSATAAKTILWASGEVARDTPSVVAAVFTSGRDSPAGVVRETVRLPDKTTCTMR